MDSVDTLLTMQNPGGGFASYERIRGPAWLELFNHAEVFGAARQPIFCCGVDSSGALTVPGHTSRGSAKGNIMTEYNYPECTTSVLSALAMFTKRFPDYRADEIRCGRAACARALSP